MFVNCLFFWTCLIWIADQTITKTILVAHSLKKTKTKLNLCKNSKKWRNIGSTSKKAYFLMKKWHNKFFWASILIEQRIGPPGNFIEFCTKSFCLLTLSLSLFNNFLGLTLKSNKFLLLKKLQLRFPTQSTVPPKWLVTKIWSQLKIKDCNL